MSCSCSRLTHPSCFCLRSLPPVSHKKIATSETPVETCAAQASLTKTGMNPGDCLAETWVQSEMTWNAANLGECCTVTYSLKTLGTARSKQRLHRRTVTGQDFYGKDPFRATTSFLHGSPSVSILSHLSHVFASLSSSPVFPRLVFMRVLDHPLGGNFLQ
jgi:hypothetical protein